MTRHIQARNSSDAYWTLDSSTPLEPGDPWFVDLEALVHREHYGVAHRLERHLGSSAARPEFVHVALLGAAGVGKATLARQAIAARSNDGITPVYIDALEVFDRSDLRFSDLMLVIAQAVFADLVERGLEVGRDQLEVVHQWFADELLSESHRGELLGGFEGTLDAELSVPLVARIAAKVTGALKSDHDYRREIRKRAERDPRDLMCRVNLLLDAVHAAVDPYRLCVVFDNLDKLELELLDRAILQRVEEFRQLRCNLLVFCSSASEYPPLGVQVSKAFRCVTVPALPVRLPGDAPHVVRAEAAAAIERLLGQRLALEEVFVDPKGSVEALAHWSGGHLGDLLQIARRAVENVAPAKVGVDDIEDAARWLGASLMSTLRPEDLPRLVELHRTHRVWNTAQDRRLLNSSCVLQYDGTAWWDVHPALRADALFLEAQREANIGLGG